LELGADFLTGNPIGLAEALEHLFVKLCALVPIGKVVIVDKTAISNCAIKHFDLFSIHILTFN
jgi:hypothetical protein